MADDEKHERVKDLLKRGSLDEHQPASADFGERVMRRHLRRPAGNSERLWRKVDGSDPWDLPAPPKPDKQRGVWAAGRFVRMEESESKKSSEAASHIPDWARKQAEQPRQPKASADPPKPEPRANPEDKIKEVIARRQAEADAQARAAAAARAAERVPDPSELDAEQAPVPQVPVGARRASISRSGRIRTQQGGSFDPSAAPANRAPDPDVQHRYAAGRAPPPPRAKPKDLPVEMRRPPKIDPNAPAPAGPPVEHRYAAGRAPPPPKAKAKDLPIEQRAPPRIGPDGQPLPPSTPPSAAAIPSTPAPGTPESLPARPKPAAASAAPSTAGNSASLDDLFGLANEGPMRIGRRAKKVAAPASEPVGAGDKDSKTPGSDQG